MTCVVNNRFQHVGSFTDQLILNALEINLKMFLDHSFLTIGSWSDVDINQTNLITSSLCKLEADEDPAFKRGRSWVSARKEWVYDNSIEYNEKNPIDIQNIQVNNNTISSGYYIDYINGRIIFNEPKSPQTTIKASFSYRNIQIHRSSECNWWQIIESGIIDPKEMKSTGFGQWTIGPYHRVQMPCIVIDAVPRARSLPYELGSKSLKIEQDILFNILAEDKNTRNQLIDIIRLQQDNTIWLFDINKAAQDSKLPLDHKGSINPTGLTYLELINEYKWAKTYIKNIVLSEASSINGIYEGVARATFEIIFDSLID
jgi:hypothetical protein